MNKEKENTVTSEVVNDGILRPTKSASEFQKENSNNNPNQRLTSRIEKYNYNQGFEPQKAIEPQINNTIEVNKQTQITIKPPKKKNKILLPLLLILIFLCIGGYFYYSEIYLKSLNTKPVIDNPLPEEPQIVTNKTVITCHLTMNEPSFGYIGDTEYKFYATDNLLKKYEINNISSYVEDHPSEQQACENFETNYSGYDGYKASCTMKDLKNFYYKTEVDLEVLKEKELVFNIGLFPEKKYINENLDDNVISYIDDFESQGYECSEEKQVEVINHEEVVSD